MNSPIRLSMLTLITLTCLGLTACGFPPRLYHMDVRQGNFITREMVSNLRVGMNKETVLQLMGSPSLNHFFERDRWDYYYYLKPGNGDPIEENHLIVYFKANQVVRLEED